MPVAKSYQKFAIQTEPFTVNGKQFVVLETGKRVRWYSDAEYKKLYGSDVPEAPKSQKEALGFTNGFITIFKGNTYQALEWFRESVCKYNKIFGWYVPSTETIPTDIPTGLEPVRINWENVKSNKNDTELKNDDAVKQYVQSLLFEPSASQFQGNLQDRIEVTVTIKKALVLYGSYGRSVMHIMEDDNQNVYVWTTSSRTLEEDTIYIIKGTVKDHRTYKNTKQTILSRCTAKRVE